MNKSLSYEPELEIVDGSLSSLRYLEHGAESDLIRWHCHSEYELHLIVSSHGKTFVGDHIGNFGPGYVYLIGPNLPHNWVSSEDSFEFGVEEIRDKVINFSQTTFDLLYEAMPEARELTVLLEGAFYGLEFEACDLNLYESMFNDVRDSQGLKKLINFFELLHLLTNDSSCKRLSSRKFSMENQLENVDLINKALTYIGQNYTQSVSLDDVSNFVGMASASSFSRFFHKATGVKYINFIKKLRVSKACERLERSDEAITSICFSVGFSNVANFNRHFMSLKGMTPRKYRNLSQKKYIAKA